MSNRPTTWFDLELVARPGVRNAIALTRWGWTLHDGVRFIARGKSCSIRTARRSARRSARRYLDRQRERETFGCQS
jgi:hypothetical protein